MKHYSMKTNNNRIYMKNLTIEFSPSKSDFRKLICQLDKYGFYNGELQPHDRERIVNYFDKGTK